MAAAVLGLVLIAIVLLIALQWDSHCVITFSGFPRVPVTWSGLVPVTGLVLLVTLLVGAILPKLIVWQFRLLEVLPPRVGKGLMLIAIVLLVGVIRLVALQWDNHCVISFFGAQRAPVTGLVLLVTLLVGAILPKLIVWQFRLLEVLPRVRVVFGLMLTAIVLLFALQWNNHRMTCPLPCPYPFQ